MSTRCTSIAKVWESKESSFALIRKNEGEQFTKYLLMDEIVKMSELISAELSKDQLIFVVNYVLENYWYFSISDVTALTTQLIREKHYGKPLLQDIIVAIDNWEIQRQNYAIEQRIKENSKFKSETLTSDDMKKIYAKMKQKQGDGISQKEKDATNKLANEKRIKEIEKLYPKND